MAEAAAPPAPVTATPSTDAAKSATPAAKGEVETAPTEESSEDAEATAVLEPGTEGDDASGDTGSDAEPAEGEEEAPKGLADDHEIDIDGEKVTLKALKELHAQRAELEELTATAEEKIAGSQRLLATFAEHTKPALIDLFTATKGKGNREAGYNHFIQFCAEAVEEHVEWEKKPEHEKQLIRERRRRMELEEKEEARTAAEKKAKAEAEVAAAQKYFEEAIPAAMKSAGLPDDGEIFDFVREEMLRVIDRGEKPIDEAEACRRVKERLKKYGRKGMETVDPDEIPEAVQDKILKQRIEKAKAPRTAVLKNPATGSTNGEKLWKPKPLGVL